MEVLHPRCAGLDVHAKTVVACVRLATWRAVTYVHRTVATHTRGLLELADWLATHEVTHVPRHSRELTHFCSRKKDHLGNTILIRALPRCIDERWTLFALFSFQGT
jgi:hypothetical protein